MLISFVRTLILYGVLILGVRLTGKRQLGNLEPAELIVTILITELAAVPLQDPEAPLLNSIIAIAALVGMEILISVTSAKYPLFGKLLQGRHSVIIRDGMIDQREMQKSDVSYDELCEALRQNGALTPSEVRYCVLENSGNMSVILKDDLPPRDIPIPLILDGKYVKPCMKKQGVSRVYLEELLRKRGMSSKEVFILTVANGQYSVIPKDKESDK
jgi:uncharacterized membrane protein YcaP (DUF421 family)